MKKSKKLVEKKYGKKTSKVKEYGSQLESDKTTVELFESADVEDVDVNQTPPTDLVAYTEFRSTADIYRMYVDNLIIIPEFQRKFIWSEKQQTLFIDSLVKQLPIPSLCFALDFTNQTWSVVDGLQRISTIIRFLQANSEWRIQNIEGVDIRLINKTSHELKEDTETTVLYRKISNITLPITVLRCDMSKHEHANYIFTVFYRLNTGGTGLNAQEIRNSMFSSEFNNLLNRTIISENWKSVLAKVFGAKELQRMGGQQFLLRCVAFANKYEKFSGGITVFLNDFMLDAKNLYKQSDIDEVQNKLQDLGNILVKIFNCKAISSQKGGKKIVTESLFVGLFHNIKTIKKLEKLSQAELNAKIEKFLTLPELSSQALSEGTATKTKILNRLKSSIEFFK